MMRCVRLILPALLATAAPAFAAPAMCRLDPRLDAAAQAWVVPAPQPSLVIDPADAICFRDALLMRVGQKLGLGPVIGYKVGAYSATARAPLGAKEPVVGLLLQHMVLNEGATVSVGYAVAPVVEADFLLVVRDAGINSAKTREEVYRHLRGYRPFVELPDNNNGTDVKPSLGRLMALNVNARLGVEGKEVPLPQTPEGFAALSNLAVRVAIQRPSGTINQQARSADTLGDPVDIVIAARDLLLREGRRLKAGDIISIGAITVPQPPVPGQVFTVHYDVPGHASQISVTFAP
jgi:2-keto-4-pentenoate hydratase